MSWKRIDASDWALFVFIIVISGAGSLCSYNKRLDMRECVQACGKAKISECEPPTVKCIPAASRGSEK